MQISQCAFAWNFLEKKQRIGDAAFASLASIQINLVIFYFYKRNGIPKERMRALILASFFLILKLALLSSANCHI